MAQEKEKTFTLSEMIPQFGLTSQEKFVCLKVFKHDEKHSLADWEKLLKTKKIR